ncbi:MAG: hypothetical protein H7144_14330 [Burkholderiales bacterium]|nr:hypothetical protein [Phycisphaerae bacterium]
MATGAQVHDINSIRLFRAALVKFTESSSVSLIDGEGEFLRKMNWLQSEQEPFWVSQVRKWTEEVSRAIDLVRQKRIFKDFLGRQQSTADEEKYLKQCRNRLQEAETKLAATRRYGRDLQREHLLLKGGVQRLSTILSGDMPKALAMLDGAVARLEAYVDSSPEMAGSTAEMTPSGAPSGTADGAMHRAADEAKEADKADEANRESNAGDNPAAGAEVKPSTTPAPPDTH